MAYGLQDSYQIGICCPQEAEEWAFLKGLQLVWNRGFKKIIIESDSKNLIEALLEDEQDNIQSLVVYQIKDLMAKSWDVRIANISPSQNQVAHKLAKDALSGSCFFDGCPTFLSILRLCITTIFFSELFLR